MFYGVLKGDEVVLTSPAQGRPIIEAEPLEDVEGYDSVVKYVDDGASIRQVLSLVPSQGTAEDAAVKLARLLAVNLEDAKAVQVPALYDEWSGEGVQYYGPNDPDGHPQTRLTRNGVLIKVLQTHVSQEDWKPEDEPSLYAVVLAGQDGTAPGEWVQPGADNGFDEGDYTFKDGRLWQSLQDDNVFMPGAPGSPWKDLGEWSSSSTPAGAHYAQAGE